MARNSAPLADGDTHSLSTAQLAKLVRGRLAELQISQPELAVRVAHALREPVVGQSAVSRWLDDLSALAPKRVFAIERALDYQPGSLSSHLGYLPVGAELPLSIVDAITFDTTLTRAQRQVLLGAYRGVTGDLSI